MTEIFFLLLQVILFLLFFLFPLNKKIIEKYFNFKKTTIYDVYVLNTLLYCLVFLILSFYKIKIDLFIYSLIFIKIILIAFNFKIYSRYFVDFNNKFFFLFFFICFLCLSTQISLNPKLGWDGIVHWYYKALNYQQGGTYENLKNSPVSYYPHLGPYIWSVFWSINKLNIEYFGRIFYLFIYITTIFSATERFSNKINFNVKLFVTLILLSLTFDSFLVSGYQEYFLFFLFYSFSLMFSFKDETKSKSLLIVFFLFLSSCLMFWVKQEGLFYIVILTIIFSLFYHKSNILKLLYITLMIIIMFASIKLRSYYHGNFSFNEPVLNSELLKYFDYKIFLNTFYLISLEIIKAIIKYPIWIIIILFLILNLIEKKKIINKENIFFIIYISFIYSIYFQTTMDIKELMPLTLDRVIFHGSGFFLIFIVKYLNDKLLLKNN
jgi:hypothetical protein